MNFLFQLHSGLRYLVLLAGLAALVYFAVGQVTKRPVGKGVRVLGAIYSGLLDLQVLIGGAMVALGRYYPQLIGHMVMMVLAVALTHILLVRNRKRPQPGYVLPLVAVGGSLVLIVGGIMAIGRGVLTQTAFVG
jgi:heme A synthase